MRFIQLEKDSIAALEKIRKTDSRYRVRDRAHAILMSNQGLKIKQIAAIFGVDRDTVSGWFGRWHEHGLAGLADAPGAGRPPKLNPDEKKS